MGVLFCFSVFLVSAFVSVFEGLELLLQLFQSLLLFVGRVGYLLVLVDLLVVPGDVFVHFYILSYFWFMLFSAIVLFCCSMFPTINTPLRHISVLYSDFGGLTARVRFLAF